MTNPVIQAFINGRKPKSTNIIYPYTQSMIKHYSDKYKDKYRNAEGTKRLIKKMKSNNFNKIYSKRKKWDKMITQIPIDYLDSLGITEKMIQTTIEMDIEEFEKNKAKPAIYTHCFYNYKWIQAIIDFEEKLNEREAVERLKDIAERNIKRLQPRYCSYSLQREPFYSIYIFKDLEPRWRENIPGYKKENYNYNSKYIKYDYINNN